ncbi:TRAP-type C4-dicarboxylate transport system permease small subunit [Fusobacterium naviforme]|nr:TRAP transporter small permease [Fusobacterium naviforme]PSL11135.1 TRAP-type C4-dicarboxylate transport system permease small subunit [Fusobacterium naviforme]STO28510.1 Neu5Ac permease [Fusobacterium naviforme]
MDKKDSKILFMLANLDIVIASAILAILILLTFLGVIWRYVLNAPFTWLEEVQTSCMVWIVFAGAGAAFRSGNHVAIEMIVDLMPERMQKVMEGVISAVVVIVIGYLFIQSLGFIQIFIKSGRSTSMLHIPYKYVYGIAILSYIDMVISYFYGMLTGVKSEAKEAADSSDE